MKIVGVDPGRAGALAILHYGQVTDVIDVPVRPDNSQVEVDGLKLCRWIDRHLPLDLVVIENVQPMRGIGNDSEAMPSGNSFRFGLICGQIRMAFQCYGINPMLVTAGQWKRHHGLLKCDKEASRQKALGLAPQAAPWLARKGDHNRAEAVLMALYALAKRGMI